MSSILQRFFLAGLLLSFALNAYSQPRMGIKGGLNYSGFSSVNLRDGWDGATASSAGWNAGFFLLFPFPGIAIQPEFLYSVKSTDALDMEFLEFPLTFRFPLFCIPRLVAPYLLGGPYASYLLHADASGEATGNDFSTKRWDYGAGLGIGVDILHRISLTARYDWGFTRIAGFSLSNLETKSRLLTLSVGMYL